ncbi:MAG: extracellular solute-binding protein, partial [Chloroflexota bacterium]
MKSLKRMLILFSLMLALTALAACGGTEPEPAPEPETTTSEEEEMAEEEEMDEEEEMEEEAMSDAVELRMTWYADGNEDVVIREILDQFEAENPDIKVVVDTVAYNNILENLPIQLAAGEGPDLARVTNLGGLSEFYLDISPYVDTDYWETNFGPFLNWVRPAGDTTGIYGMMTQLTVTGPYINATLFEQAGVEVPTGDVTWE